MTQQAPPPSSRSTPHSSDARRTQQAIVQSRYGPVDEVLSHRTDLPVLPPSATQVQIEVRAASINPIDWQMIQGNRRMIARRTFPFVPLFDLAGVVTAVGTAVCRFEVGDVVHCNNQIDGGGASQFVNVEEGLVRAVPPSLGFAEAAAIPLAGQTALLALDRATVGPGDSVVVIGASGGVGSFVIQMAKALGARRVIAICSGRNEQFVRDLGADEVIDYEVQPMETVLAARSIDVVIDCVGGRAQWIAAKRIMRDGGRFATISRDEDDKVTLAAVIRLVPPVLWRRSAARFGRRLHYLTVFLDASHTLLERVDTMVASGAVRPHVAQTFDFDVPGVVAALNTSRHGRVTGKLVVNVADPKCCQDSV